MLMIWIGRWAFIRRWTIVYFMVEDCATQQERTEKAGGRVIRPKFSIGEFGWVLICQDTEGNMIGFNSMK